ncbi:thioesterase II family protein [Streptomyces sp. NPDC001544]|uniref:thioesterase II family protein n=1 Tax=Streptomyces sp. NPDC001544 TaxID=3364584 RepID=UPI003676951B
MNHAGTRASVWVQPMTAHAGRGGRLRLFCFPYAGSGTRAFRGWAEELPDDMDVYGIQLPGRDNRLGERPLDDVTELLDELVPALEPYADGPFAFFGHSMGALLCWETARSMWRAHGLLPRHVFVSGCKPPPLIGDRTGSGASAPEYSDAELIERIRALGGTPEEILQDAGLMSLVLPAFRGDCTMLARYRYVPGEPLPCPLTVFGGDRDPRAAPEELDGWAELVKEAPDVCLLPGGHFFLHTERKRLLAEISARLSGGYAPRHV